MCDSDSWKKLWRANVSGRMVFIGTFEELDAECEKVPSRKEKQDFYNTWEWKALRYRALKKYGRKCASCGAGKDDCQLHVDHILPVSTHWSSRWEMENLQVLCRDCNMGKSNTSKTDFRPWPTWENVTDEDRRVFLEFINFDLKKGCDLSVFTPLRDHVDEGRLLFLRPPSGICPNRVYPENYDELAKEYYAMDY